MSQRDIFYLFDSPVEYKGLKLYPVTMEDFYIFNTLSSCLMLEKNSISEPVMAVKAISMTYLEYLLSVANEENMLEHFLSGLLKLILGKKDDEGFRILKLEDKNGRPVLGIDGKSYDSSDFDELRLIIAEQNDIDLPDERIQKTVRDSLEEARRFKQKISGSKTASLEEQVMTLSLYSGWTLDDIKKMTIRKFFMAVRRLNHMHMSSIYLTASMSGFVSFKDKSILKGWFADLNGDKYGDAKIDLEDMKKKVGQANSPS